MNFYCNVSCMKNVRSIGNKMWKCIIEGLIVQMILHQKEKVPLVLLLQMDNYASDNKY